MVSTTTEVEIWRPVVGWEQLYEVSSAGRVKSLDKVQFRKHARTGKITGHRHHGRILKLEQMRMGYIGLRLWRDGASKRASAHHLVCEAFHGPKPAGHEVAHRDGARCNNRAENLMWATHVENCRHRSAHGTVRFGERNHNAKLSQSVVRKIRAGPFYRGRDRHLAEQFGVSSKLVGMVRRREIWRNDHT